LITDYPQVGGNLWITVDNTVIYEDNLEWEEGKRRKGSLKRFFGKVAHKVAHNH
jgi:hypothetical protein